MDNVPVRVNSSAPAGHNASRPSQGGSHNGKKKKTTPKLVGIIIAAVVVVLALVGSGLLVYRSSTNATIETNKYQAVFFTSGQVYFGKLQQINRDYFKLTNVFYIQAQATSDTTSSNPQKAGTDKNSDLQLIKLGSEVHGPDDEMIISKDQVLFFENLKKDGKVTESIDKYLSQKK